MVELAGSGPERSFRRERADMQFIEHRLVPGATGPGRIGPAVGRRIDHFARAMHVLRLEARRRVGHLAAVRQAEAVERARPRRLRPRVRASPRPRALMGRGASPSISRSTLSQAGAQRRNCVPRPGTHRAPNGISCMRCKPPSSPESRVIPHHWLERPDRAAARDGGSRAAAAPAHGTGSGRCRRCRNPSRAVSRRLCRSGASRLFRRRIRAS